MKKYFCIVVIIGIFFVFGCDQDQKARQSSDIPQEEITTVVSAQGTKVTPIVEVTAAPEKNSVKEGARQAAQSSMIEPPANPSEKDIQQALKNAGFYDGDIDGKIGPKTKKAIGEFQAKNNLKVDGKAGPNTWNVLKEHFVSSDAAVPEDIKD